MKTEADTETSEEKDTRQTDRETTSINKTHPQEDSSYPGKLMCPVFAVFTSISALTFIFTCLALYIDELKFTIRGRLFLYVSSYVFVGVIYVTMFVSYVFQDYMKLSKKLKYYNFIVLIIFMGGAQSTCIAIVSAYHDTEIPLLIFFSTCCTLLLVTISMARCKINCVGWQTYVRSILSISVILAIEITALCLKAYCEYWDLVIYASAIAVAATLYVVISVQTIFHGKCKSVRAKEWTKATVLSYIFIPVLLMHLPEVIQNR